MRSKFVALLVICVFVFTGLMTGCGGLEPLTEEEIMSMDDMELCTDLYIQIVLSDIDEENYEESVRSFNESKEKFYILSDFDTEYFAGGLAEYLYYTDCAFVEDTEALLREFGLTEMADMYGEFFEENDIDFDKYMNSEEDFIERIEADYPIEEFNEEFDKIYDDEKLYKVLADYVRDNVKDFI